MRFLGYDFSNEDLLNEALTTPSYRMDVPSARDNQRLEFLGDAVLGLLSAMRVYEAFPDEQEGPLTVRRTHMVSSAALCEVACRHGVVSRLRRNRRAAPLPRNSKTLADAIEAIMGAAYLDGGLAAAQQIFANINLSENAAEDAWLGNAKGYLQVKAQAMKPQRHPQYELLKTEGRAHEPVFTVRVTVDGMGSATASARTRKEAESKAAAALLHLI